MDESHDELISQFCGITGSSHAAASEILPSANWSLEDAVRLFYESQEEPQEPEEEVAEMDQEESRSGPAGQGSGQPRQPQGQARLRTLRDIQGGGAGDDSDDEDDHRQDFFAGGEKSGLAVQNPNNNNGGSADHFNNIINQARQNRPRPGDEDEPVRSSNFAGRAQTLGGDDAPSRLIDDPDSASRPSTLPRVTRTLHLWQDGFSVDDGPLFRFDDPANAPTLALINQGRAPLALLGVEPGQEVDLNLSPHKDEEYVQPKKKYRAFEGSGQRLGSPTPGPSGVSAPPPAAAPAASSAPATAAPSVDIDESAPTVTLQIRLGDGSRVQSRFNTTHTIGDVYAYVHAVNPSPGRGYALMTTFPSKELADKSVQLGDLAEFKRGGVMVQKWT